MQKNYRFILNILFIGGVSLLLASCAREKGAISYQNEKLRKQSLEIENSTPLSENKMLIAAPVNSSQAFQEAVKVQNHGASHQSVSGKVSEMGEKTKMNKLNPQSMMAKKVVKKLTASKSGQALDENLKMAIIFAAIAIILSILSPFSNIFWALSAIAFVIAIVFLVLWLLEQ